MRNPSRTLPCMMLGTAAITRPSALRCLPSVVNILTGCLTCSSNWTITTASNGAPSSVRSRSMASGSPTTRRSERVADPAGTSSRVSTTDTRHPALESDRDSGEVSRPMTSTRSCGPTSWTSFASMASRSPAPPDAAMQSPAAERWSRQRASAIDVDRRTSWRATSGCGAVRASEADAALSGDGRRGVVPSDAFLCAMTGPSEDPVTERPLHAAVLEQTREHEIGIEVGSRQLPGCPRVLGIVGIDGVDGGHRLVHR